MTKIFYLDTCVWRDFYEDRFSKSGRPLGKYATQLFLKIINKKDKIMFSESLVWELRKDYDDEEIHNMLAFLFANNTLIRIEITSKDSKEARRLSKQKGLSFIDCLHAVQARNHGAIMVSQDKHFTENLSDVIKAVRPEEII